MTNSPTLKYAIGVVGVLLSLSVWQLAATVGPMAAAPLPSVTESFAALGGLIGTAQLWQATADTVVMAIIGLALATAVGIVLGIGIGVSPLAMHATRVPLEFLKPIPPIVVLPITVLVMGPTMAMGIFLIFIGSFVAIAVQTSAGVFDTEPVLRDTGRSYGMRRGEVLGRIVLPSALPYIGTAIRVSAPVSLVIAVVAGLLGGSPGLGKSIFLAQVSGRQDVLFAYVIVLGVLGLIFQWLSQYGEQKLLYWHPQYRKEAA
ncbi:ABC transporter permease [Microbacterium sp.]|uniref:ABC transporter permease n=1 Tax=Microbacterium sp. TaxID=51671 RepID=UPI003A8541A2